MPAACLPTVRASLTNGPRRDLRHLRPAGQHRHRIRRRERRHPPRSPSTASRNGGAPRAASAIPTPRRCRSSPDSGGSNGCPPRAWKFNLQPRICNRHGLRVTVAHYPTATSTWTPIEHRLFCGNQQDLARPPSGQLRDHPEIPAHHTHADWAARTRAHREKSLRRPASRSPTPQYGSYASHRTASCPNGTTPSTLPNEHTSLFLRGPLSCESDDLIACAVRLNFERTIV